MSNIYKKLIEGLAESENNKEKYYYYLKRIVEENAKIVGDKIIADIYFKELAAKYPHDANAILLKEKLRTLRNEYERLKKYNGGPNFKKAFLIKREIDKLKILLKKEETQSFIKSSSKLESISSFLKEKSINEIKENVDSFKDKFSNFLNKFNKNLPPSISNKGQLIDSLNIRRWSNENVSRYLMKGLKNASIHHRSYKKVMERLEKAKKERIWWI
ncbi:MAG: hypothetical protein QXF09_03620 [Nitrososphaerota archaeon]